MIYATTNTVVCGGGLLGLHSCTLNEVEEHLARLECERLRQVAQRSRSLADGDTLQITAVSAANVDAPGIALAITRSTGPRRARGMRS